MASVQGINRDGAIVTVIFLLFFVLDTLTTRLKSPVTDPLCPDPDFKEGTLWAKIRTARLQGVISKSHFLAIKQIL